MLREFKGYPAKLVIPLLSLLILTILGVQASISFPWRYISTYIPAVDAVGEALKPPSAWPFLDYRMYAITHYEGDQILRERVFASLQASSEVEVLPGSLGVNYWQFQNGLISDLLAGDRERVLEWVDVYESRHGGRIVSLRVENHPLVFSGDGVEVAKPVLLTELGLGRGSE